MDVKEIAQNSNGTAEASAIAGPELAEIRPFTAANVKYVVDQDPQKHSFDYWVDELLVLGLTTWKQRRKNAELSSNRREFDKAVSRDSKFYRENPAELLKLMEKFSIGQSSTK